MWHLKKLSIRTKTVAGMIAGLAIVAGATGTTAAAAGGAPAEARNARAAASVQDTKALTMAAEMKIADAAQKEAAKRDQRVAVAIVDRSGDVRLIVKGDGAGPQTVESAKRKAYTAAAFGQPTSKLTDGASGDAPNTSDIPGTLFLAGGIPVASGGNPIAGIGVGGAPDGKIDESIAQAGLKVVSGQLG